MRLRIKMIDWEYPAQREPVTPEYWDLTDQNRLMMLYLAFANGIILELSAEGDEEQAIEVIRGLVGGGGSGNKIEMTEAEKEQLWLYQDGYECYKQGRRDSEGGFFFVNPIPQPQLFQQKEKSNHEDHEGRHEDREV